MKALSIVLPVKNEEKRLTITITDIHSFLKQKGIKHEIIAAISSSEDHSLAIAQRLEKGIKELIVIDLKEDKGKGFALKQGIKKASHPWILLMNSDNAISIVELEKMIPYTDEFELIISEREKIKKELQEPAQNFQQRCGRVCKSIVSAWKVHDSQCGFKLISKKLANKIVKKSRANSYSFETEIIAIAKEQHTPVKEISVNWQDTREKSLSSEEYGDGLQNFLDIKENIRKGSYKGS